MRDLPKLTWFPKRLGPGDIHGEGQRRILGQPNIDIMDLLIRETAQNSWDARIPNKVPEYQLRLRELDETAVGILRDYVFRDNAPNLPLQQFLSKSPVTAIEVIDRNTKGLGGTTRNDLGQSDDQPRDYANFVLSLGAPPSTQGAGTYGFGKTASYLASECSTIVIWTRAHDANGNIVDRFIASAMGESFEDRNGTCFTGRQWWALLPPYSLLPGEFRFEPVTGDAASRYGRLLFERGFEKGETGTSLMILQPRWRNNDDVDGFPRSLVNEWAEITLKHLWPKVRDDQPPARQMKLSIYDHGKPVSLPSGGMSPILRHQELCLDAIRSHQSDNPEASDPMVTVEEVWCFRPQALLGHIAMTRVLGWDEDDPHSEAKNTITYMRSEAELVVKAIELPGEREDRLPWVAVFKPMPALESTFAEAEPPAHDDWQPNGLSEPRSRTFVRIALRRSIEKVRDYLAPKAVASGTDELASTGALSAALAGLTGSASGSLASGSRSGSRKAGSGQRRSALSRPLVRSATPLPINSHELRERRQSTSFEIEVDGAPGDTQRLLKVAALNVAHEGGTLKGDDLLRLEGWIDPRGLRATDPELRVDPGDVVHAEISYPLGLAIEVSFCSEAAQ